LSPEDDQRIALMQERIEILEVEVARLRLDLEAKSPSPAVEAPDIVNPPTEYLEKSEKVISLEKDNPF